MSSSVSPSARRRRRVAGQVDEGQHGEADAAGWRRRRIAAVRCRAAMARPARPAARDRARPPRPARRDGLHGARAPDRCDGTAVADEGRTSRPGGVPVATADRGGRRGRRHRRDEPVALRGTVCTKRGLSDESPSAPRTCRMQKFRPRSKSTNVSSPQSARAAPRAGRPRQAARAAAPARAPAAATASRVARRGAARRLAGRTRRARSGSVAGRSAGRDWRRHGHVQPTIDASRAASHDRSLRRRANTPAQLMATASRLASHHAI